MLRYPARPRICGLSANAGGKGFAATHHPAATARHQQARTSNTLQHPTVLSQSPTDARLTRISPATSRPTGPASSASRPSVTPGASPSRCSSVAAACTCDSAAPRASLPASADSRRQEDARTAILRHARSHDGTTTAAATELLGVKDYTARRLLNAMVGEGLLEKTGGRKGRVCKVV